MDHGGFSGPITDYSIGNLRSSTTYDFVLSAVYSAGSHPLSGVVTGTTAAVAGVVPGAVTQVKASVPTTSALVLTWVAPVIAHLGI